MTWMHPRSKQWHLLDYIIVRQRDVMNVLETRALRRADCGANHVMLKTRLKVCRRNQHCGTGGKLPRKLDTCALKGQRKQKELTQKDWDSNNSEKDKDEKWATLKDICIKLRVMFEATLERNIKIGLMSMINIWRNYSKQGIQLGRKVYNVTQGRRRRNIQRLGASYRSTLERWSPTGGKKKRRNSKIQ